eukprot:240958-Rhodomonas_salina.4
MRLRDTRLDGQALAGIDPHNTTLFIGGLDDSMDDTVSADPAFPSAIPFPFSSHIVLLYPARPPMMMHL